MKILMIAPWHSVHSTRPLRWLAERGCDVTFMDHRRPSPPPGCNYRFVRYPWLRGSSVLGGIGRKLNAWAVPLLLRRCWRRLRPDMVHVHWVDVRAYDCARAGLRPLVLTIWGSDVNSLLTPDADATLRRQVGEALARADLVIADSPDMPDKCRTLAGRQVHVEIITLGIATQRFRPGDPERAAAWRRQLQVPEGATVLLSARAFQGLYGQHLILEAFGRAAPRLCHETVLVFKQYNQAIRAATAQAYEAALRRRAEELGVAHLLRWLPEVPYEQLPEVYAFSDVVVNFPLMDAFPVTFLEAAACERPVITCRLPAYVGTFAERYFRMVDPGDVEGLADAIADSVNDPGERCRHVAAARREVEARHDEAVSAERLLELYRGVLGGRGQTAPAGPAPCAGVN